MLKTIGELKMFSYSNHFYVGRRKGCQDSRLLRVLFNLQGTVLALILKKKKRKRKFSFKEVPEAFAICERL